MPPELLDYAKILVPAGTTLLSGLVIGIYQQKSKNRDNEFVRFNKVLDEVQEENRELRKELRLLRTEHAQERATDKAEIQNLKDEVASLRAENAELRRRLFDA